MQTQPNPELVRAVAGIDLDSSGQTLQTRSLVTARYVASKTVVLDRGLCLQREASDEPCAPCRLDAPEDRLCVRYKVIMNGTIETNE